MRVQPSDGDKAAEITPLVVWLIVFVQPHLCGRPAFQIACAVDCAEAFSICWKAKFNVSGALGPGGTGSLSCIGM